MRKDRPLNAPPAPIYCIALRCLQYSAWVHRWRRCSKEVTFSTSFAYTEFTYRVHLHDKFLLLSLPLKPILWYICCCHIHCCFQLCLCCQLCCWRSLIPLVLFMLPAYRGATSAAAAIVTKLAKFCCNVNMTIPWKCCEYLKHKL